MTDSGDQVEPTIEVRLYKVASTGQYELRVRDRGASASLVLNLGIGEPYKYAHRAAERLAIAVNCDLYLNDVLIRSPPEELDE